MSDLTIDVLIGVDTMAKLGIGIPLPPKRSKINIVMCTVNRESEKEKFERFLATELSKFKNICGPTDLTEHKICLKTDLSIKQRYRPRNPAMQKIIDDEVREMERAGVIEPSQSPWSSPIVIAKKKDGRLRFCIDFRKVNEVSEKDAYIASSRGHARQTKRCALPLYPRFNKRVLAGPRIPP